MIAVIVYNAYQYQYWAGVNKIDLEKKDCLYKRVSTMKDVHGVDFTDYIDMSYLNKRPWIMLEKVREEVRARVRYNKIRNGRNDIQKV